MQMVELVSTVDANVLVCACAVKMDVVPKVRYMHNLCKLKDGNIVQVELVGDDMYDFIDLSSWTKETDNHNKSWDEFIIFKLNEFCQTHDILDIEVVSRVGSNYHDGTFSKTSETISRRPSYVVYYQIKKPEGDIK
jgi:hypothetical protein